MFKIIGIVTSYYPNLDDLEKNIHSYLPWIDQLIIWENTPDEQSVIDQLIDRLHSDKVEIYSTGKNEYLAFPFNETIRLAQKQGYTHLLTMDQDSCFDPNHFQNYLNIVQQSNIDPIAAFGPGLNLTNNFEENIQEVPCVITSGAIYPINILIDLHLFNEELAIDVVDIEYCVRSRNKGYKIVQINSIHLQHKIGNIQKHWTGLIFNPYPAQRTYYYIRNTLWLWKHFPDVAQKQERRNFIRYKIIYRTLKIGFESDAFQKLLAIYTAIWHVYTGRLGKYDKFNTRR